MIRYAISIDLGASNGRVMLGEFDGYRINLEEIKRFENGYTLLNEQYYWDILQLYRNILDGLKDCASICKNAETTIGIDTWGVDFALLDKNGQLLGLPRSYRDPGGGIGMSEFSEEFGSNAAFEISGIANYPFNTLFQLFYLKKRDDIALKNADKLLLLPDYLSYLLSGKISAEYTNATTTQILDYKMRNWSPKILDMIGVKKAVFPEIQEAGTIKGKMLFSIKRQTGFIQSPNIVCVGSHDTASAIASIPNQTEEFAFISSGTWSLVGMILEKPIVTEKAFLYGLSNEGTVDGKYSLQNSSMGMWLIQNCKKHWDKNGQPAAWGEITHAAKSAEPFVSTIDINDERFYSGIDAIKEIASYCRQTNQLIPESIGQIARVIYESMAFCYREILDKIYLATNKLYKVIHVVGGGARNGLLNQYIANVTNTSLVAGPYEATAIGNILEQLKSKNALNSSNEGIELIKRSFEIKTYMPVEHEKWEEKYREYLKIKSLKTSIGDNNEI